MADEGNEDSWLYGNEIAQAHFAKLDEDSTDNAETQESLEPEKFDESKILDSTTEQDQLDNHPDFEDAVGEDAGDGQNTNDSKFEDDGDDSDDSDDINVVIGDIKSGPTYNIKQRPAAPGGPQTQDKPKHSTGKFNIEEFESVGSINGVPAHEFNIESIEDKPWRKPGADITDYFNYGFNEDTWRAYCERQKKMRIHESGVGLASLTINSNAAGNNPNDPNKMGIRIGMNRPGSQTRPGVINVIGSGSNMQQDRGMQQMIRPPAPKENVIQVMTADRREYSRTVVSNKFDMPPPAFNPEDFYHHESDAYNYDYEPTQASQWGPEGNNPGWAPSDIKELTPGQPQTQPNQMPPQMGGPPVMGGMPPGPIGMPIPPLNLPPPMRMPMGMPNKMMMPGDKDRERDERRDREKNDDMSERRRYDRERRERESPSRDRDRRERERMERERERRDRDRERERPSERRSGRSRSRERSSRRERSRSRGDRERSSRRERERERSTSKDRNSRKDKKKSHKKDKEETAE